jgi:hypothetical protein
MRMSLTPPADKRTTTSVAPASSALSTNSRTTEAGRGEPGQRRAQPG